MAAVAEALGGSMKATQPAKVSPASSVRGDLRGGLRQRSRRHAEHPQSLLALVVDERQDLGAPGGVERHRGAVGGFGLGAEGPAVPPARLW